MLTFITLIPIMLRGIMLSLNMPISIMLSLIMLSVIMLNFVMLSVLKPQIDQQHCTFVTIRGQCYKTFFFTIHKRAN